MNILSGISWSAPSPIQWGSLIIGLTGFLWYRRTPILEAFYLSFLVAMGGGWLYEFTPMIFHGFRPIVFFKFNAIKVFFIEFQLFCLPIVAYIIVTTKKYKPSKLLIPSFLFFLAWSAFRPDIEKLVRLNLFYAYRWYIRLPAILFLVVWVSGVQGWKEKTILFPKIRKYVGLIPYRVQQYGRKTMLYKLVIDFMLACKIPIPKKFRWQTAHTFQTSWKFQQQNQYGETEYNRRIDLKSIEVMTKFYDLPLAYMGKTFVDVGCGTRGVLPIIEAERRIGIDPVISKLESFEFPEGVEYLSEKAENISLPDESVDVVCCNNTLNHVEDENKALSEMHRILKPGGLFLLEVFIEPENISHTIALSVLEYQAMVYRLFTPVNEKYEQLQVEVEIDETHDGFLPMRWGGVFLK